MARSKLQFIPTPRVLDKFQVASLLGKSTGWFDDKREKLKALGFPKRDDFLGGWDADAIEYWLDARAGIQSNASSGGDQDWMEAIDGQD